MDPSRYEHPALTADDDRPVVIADVEGLEEGGRRPRPKHCRRKGDDDPVNDVDNASRARNVPKSKLAQKSKELGHEGHRGWPTSRTARRSMCATSSSVVSNPDLCRANHCREP
ncbi:hypothetical protein BHE74_00026295 [Ensete ventricosum]|nr:hypothetical protein GW17_00000415 [Ensete ventricosum]RWW66330.1 hypothetical protein BHE74_00026295 [Ensete ventricosum]RZR83053.1 hypothetical protein BHM03_00009590 [Ensete ventricosum]